MQTSSNNALHDFGEQCKSGNFTVVLVVLGVALVAGIVGFLFKDVIVNKMKQHKKNK